MFPMVFGKIGKYFVLFHIEKKRVLFKRYKSLWDSPSPLESWKGDLQNILLVVELNLIIPLILPLPPLALIQRYTFSKLTAWHVF